MITFGKSSSCPSFGSLRGRTDAERGERGYAYVYCSAYGHAVAEAIWQISDLDARFKILKYAVMPDHVHFLLVVNSRLDEALGFYMARLKDVVNKKLGMTGVFLDGFNDQIVFETRSLDDICKYLDDNPWRLAVRRANPEWFATRRNWQIGEVNVELYGNLALLDNPFKEQVIVHRSDTDEIYKSKMDRWEYVANNGGVLISPFVSSREKAILNDFDLWGGKAIIITQGPFPPRYKPYRHLYHLCSQGRALIIGVKDLPQKEIKRITRDKCIAMNNLAALLLRSGAPPERS